MIHIKCLEKNVLLIVQHCGQNLPHKQSIRPAPVRYLALNEASASDLISYEEVMEKKEVTNALPNTCI